MNKIKLPSNVARKVNKVGFKLKKHSPELESFFRHTL